jgi:hypothetical protein
MLSAIRPRSLDSCPNTSSCGCVTFEVNSLHPLHLLTLDQGETENQILDFAKQRNGEVEVGIARPGMIKDGTPRQGADEFEASATMKMPNITVQKVARAMLKQVVQGFEMETIGNDDLNRIGSVE